MRTRIIIAVAAVFSFSAVTRTATASNIAFDTAGDSAYNNGWTSGSNGGYGWGGGWTFEFVDTGISEIASDPASGGVLNSPDTPEGRAWAFSENATAIRPFSGPLLEAQSFSIDLDAGNSGIGILFAGTQSANYFAVTSSARNFQLIENVGFRGIASTVDTGVPVINGPVEVTLLQPQMSTYFIQVQSLSSPNTVAKIDVGGFPLIPDEVELGGPSSLTYVNNMTITPEPSAFLLAAVAALGLLRRRTRVRRGA